MKTKPHERLFSHYPLLQIALAFATGVYVASARLTTLTPFLLACLACSLFALLTLIAKRHSLAGVGLLAAMFFAGVSLAVIEQRPGAPNSLKQLLEKDTADGKQTLVLTGVLAGPPEYARDRLYLTVKVESVSMDDAELKTVGLVSLLATFKNPGSDQEYRQLGLRYGARIRIRTALNRVDQYRNPGVSQLTEYLDRKGYDATGIIKSPGAIVRLGDTSVFGPLALLYRWREQLQHAIDHSFSPETSGVLDAALLGNRYNLSKPTAERFREGGTFHVLVISGLHISFIGGLAFLVARKLTRKRFLQFVSSNTFVWSYTFAVGAEASVVRAALMFTIVALGSVLFRSTTPLNALGGAALALLVTRPKDLFDPSLQLTFLSVLAIVSIGWPLLHNFGAIGRWRPTRSTPYPPNCSQLLKSACEAFFWSESLWKAELDRSAHHYSLFKTSLASWFERTHLQSALRYLVNTIVVSLAVQLMLLPLLVVYFHRLSVSSLILNVAVSVLIAILSFVSLIALLVSCLSITFAHPLFAAADGVNWLMVHAVDPLARIGMTSMRLPEYSGGAAWLFFLYYVPLIVLMVALTRWQPLSAPRSAASSKKATVVVAAAVMQLILIVVVVGHPFSTKATAGLLRIDFLDVGQGDAALITMPDGTTLLIDGGGRPSFHQHEIYERDSRSIGEMVVSEYLWWRGLDSVDYVLATHADADHIDGLNDVVRNFSVKSALVGRTPADDVEYAKFSQTVHSSTTPVEVVQAGDVLHFGGVTATVLWPNSSTASSQNNDSVVLKLQFGERSVLFTGDIEKDAERQLVAQNLSVDVVKVPHHGSRTSSTEAFVAATSPQLAIISVGRTSMFGHPHPEVVERWKNSGAQVLTTGQCGTITLWTDGKKWIVKKYVE